MKFTLSWLKDYLDTDANLDEISEKLTSIGLEVDGIENPAEAMTGFVVGEVIACDQHPDADRLKVTTVDTGSEKLQVVCGAPNCRLGLKGVFAPAGSYIAGLDVTLKKTKIRGQESNGMLCSEKELMLSEDHEGIIDLPADTPVGANAAEVLGLNDPVIEIGLTPNRGDCAGIYGIARDLAAAGLGTLKTPDTTPVKGSFDNPVSIDIQEPDACPLFLGRYIKGVKNDASPAWLQQRLKAIGLRPISVLVDITNYFTIALNRPLHVYDADKLSGNIHVRFSKKGEKLDALNDKSYDLDDGMTAICDDSGVLGLGGIIGGVPSSVDENTKNIYLECAYFNPLQTALTGRALQIDSDARYRFERGIDPAFTLDGIELATKMIQDLCGGDASNLIQAGNVPDISKTISYAPDRVAQLGGCDVEPARQKEILTALGFTVDDAKGTWVITTPSWRHDVEGSADIVEEILRIVGLDNLPSLSLPKDDSLPPALTAEQKRVLEARLLLAARGLLESVTWSFMDEKTADLFGAAANENKKSLILVNPISSDLSIMRPSALANLIQAAIKNEARGFPNAALFEVGNIYHSVEPDGQIKTATGIRTGEAISRHWADQPRTVDAYDVKADVMAVAELAGLNPDSLQITTDAPAHYHPGRSGTVRLGKNIVAHFGEIHPAVLADMKVDFPVSGFEIFMDNLPSPRKKASAQKPLLKLSAFQPVSRDFAFIVDQTVPADKITGAIRGVDKKLITDITVFDIYIGKGVEDGKKSVALSITLQPVEKTLTDAEINDISKKIVQAVEQKTGGILRG